MRGEDEGEAEGEESCDQCEGRAGTCSARMARQDEAFEACRNSGYTVQLMSTFIKRSLFLVFHAFSFHARFLFPLLLLLIKY